jgi:hypothetical protein
MKNAKVNKVTVATENPIPKIRRLGQPPFFLFDFWDPSLDAL